MHRIRLILLFGILLIVNTAESQTVIRGCVFDAETNEPIVGATVTYEQKSRLLTVTNADGQFQIPRNNDSRLKISYIGYKTLITAPTKDGRYLIQAEISRLGEVVVTAQESRGLTSASKIEKHAMEHLQPSSFADLLELLPGGQSKDPVLNAANTIRLREANPMGSDYAPFYTTNISGQAMTYTHNTTSFIEYAQGDDFPDATSVLGCGSNVNLPVTEIEYSYDDEQPSGVNDIAQGKTVAGVKYYGIDGKQLSQPQGVTIAVTTFTDGTTKTEKIVK